MNTKETQFISYMNDIMFKYLFGYDKNIRFTEYLLEVLLGKEKGSLHNKIEIVNSLKLDKISYESHGFELDISIKMEDKSYIILEAYTKFELAEKIKSLMYLAHSFSSQIKKGEKYTTAKRRSEINLVMLGKKEIDNEYELRDIEKLSKYVDNLFDLKVINIENIPDKLYNEDERKYKLFKFLSSKSKEEAERYAKGDEMLMEMYKSAEDFASDKWASEYFSYKRYYRGEGIDEGRNTEKIEIAKKMMNKKYSLKDISELTDLSKEEIKKLKS